MNIKNEDFYVRPTLEVAKDLIGCQLVVDSESYNEIIATITEVEAYLGQDDPASHAYRGPTKRSSVMFDTGGRTYVYRSYGVHFCMNIVTESRGVAGAVLLRSANVEKGWNVIKNRRRENGRKELAYDRLLSGPGTLCLGCGITLMDNNLSVCDAISRIKIADRVSNPSIVSDIRIGISNAKESMYRFLWYGHRSLSKQKIL